MKKTQKSTVISLQHRLVKTEMMKVEFKSDLPRSKARGLLSQ